MNIYLSITLYWTRFQLHQQIATYCFSAMVGDRFFSHSPPLSISPASLSIYPFPNDVSSEYVPLIQLELRRDRSDSEGRRVMSTTGNQRGSVEL